MSRVKPNEGATEAADAIATELPKMMLRQASQQQCPACTFLNPHTSLKCEMCETPLHSDSETTTQSSSCHSSLGSPSTPSEHMKSGFLKVAAQHSELLSQLYAYILARLPQLHRFCVNCDRTHLTFLGSVGEREMHCDQALCVPARALFLVFHNNGCGESLHG